MVDMEMPVTVYGAIAKIPSTRVPPPHMRDSLTHVDCYMDGVISVVHGGPERQHQVFDGTVLSLKWLFPSIPGYSKDSVSVNQVLVGEGDWTCVK